MTAKGSAERLRRLEQLADAGSPLAMVIVGDMYLWGRNGLEKSEDLGRTYLEKASDKGSVEGAYRLARYLQHAGDFQAAKAVLEKLDLDGYAPASWQLGYGFLKGSWGPDEKAAISYFHRAASLGHLWGAWWVHWLRLRADPLSRQTPLAISRVVLSIFKVRVCELRNAHSDRLRIW